MDTETKIARLREIVEGDDSDAILLSYLQQSGAVIMSKLMPYPEPDYEYDEMAVPARYEWKQIRIAAFLLNKRGAEGETQHIENGTHRNYRSADVPPDMLSDIVPMIGIPR